MNLTALLFVGCGGALGAIARYSLTVLLPRQAHELPYSTFLANVIGCFVMGVVLQWLADSDWLGGSALVHEPYRLLLAVGFCGSFTTLSALVFEMSAMLQRNEIVSAFTYLLASVVGGMLCFYLGVALARMLSANG